MDTSKNRASGNSSSEKFKIALANYTVASFGYCSRKFKIKFLQGLFIQPKSSFYKNSIDDLLHPKLLQTGLTTDHFITKIETTRYSVKLINTVPIGL